MYRAHFCGRNRLEKRYVFLLASCWLPGVFLCFPPALEPPADPVPHVFPVASVFGRLSSQILKSVQGNGQVLRNPCAAGQVFSSQCEREEHKTTDDQFGSGFDNPPEMESQDDANQTDYNEEEEAEAEFDDPAGNGSSDVEAAEMAFAEGGAEAFSEDLLSVHDGIVQCLERSVAKQSASGAAMAENAFEGAGNILGVGLGVNDDDEQPFLDADPGAQCVTLYVAEPMGFKKLRLRSLIRWASPRPVATMYPWKSSSRERSTRCLIASRFDLRLAGSRAGTHG